jgi:hypothetical protein
MNTLQQSASHGLKALRPTLVETVIALSVYVVGAILLWISAPHHGEFWWSDSPRHALNGVFVKDLIAAFPWRDPVGFAEQYYVQYPALTILFYPPLFYLVSAPFFAIFGVSHATALSVVILHYIALAAGLYVLARRWLSFPIALAVGLAAMAVPEIALWGRQVMLEIPAMTFAVWAFVLLRRYGDEARPVFLYCGAFLLLCAIYTKFSAIFLVPVMGLMLLVMQGNAVWRNRHIWISAALFIIGFIPVAFLTLKFGQTNIQSAVALPTSEVDRTSLAGWIWYATKLPEQLGWPILLASLFGIPAAMLSRRVLDKADYVLLLGWIVIGYLFFSAIDLKEARHSTLLLPPLLISAGLTAERLLPTRLSAVLAMLTVIGTGAYTWRYVPVPEVDGYSEAADWIAEHAPQKAVVQFSGYRDGSFIFNMRSHEDRRDLYMIRADKLLLEIAVRREAHVDQKSFTTQQIGEMLDRYGVQYVVAQTDFWTDLEVMANLQNLLQSDHFEAVATIPVTANIPTEDKELRIYRNTHPIDAKRPEIELDLPIIGRSVEGHVGSQP